MSYKWPNIISKPGIPFFENKSEDLILKFGMISSFFILTCGSSLAKKTLKERGWDNRTKLKKIRFKIYEVLNNKKSIIQAY